MGKFRRACETSQERKRKMEEENKLATLILVTSEGSTRLPPQRSLTALRYLRRRRNLIRVMNLARGTRPLRSLARTFTDGPHITSTPPSSSTPPVQGLSKNCLTFSEPTGPGASKSGNYKNPEYFCYDKNSYFEAEIEMLKYRLPQPSSKMPVKN